MARAGRFQDNQLLDDFDRFGMVEPPHHAIVVQVYIGRTSLDEELVINGL